MTDEFAITNLEDVNEEPFPESGLPHRKLTQPLGCTEVRLNAVTLLPGQFTALHAHERQEEVYVAFDGGCVQIDGKIYDVSPRGIVRIGPESVRSLRNETDDREQTWLMIGAPPHGTVEDFGEYKVSKE